MPDDSPKGILDALPEPIQKLYRLFWRTEKSRGGRAATRLLSHAEIDQRLRKEQVWMGGYGLGDEYKPLLDLNSGELDSAASDTVLCGEQDYFKQLLARAFELAHAEGYGLQSYAVECLLGYKWREWPPEEQRAIEDCLLFLWREALQKQQLYSAHEIRRNAVELGAPLLPFLEAWLQSDASAWVIYDDDYWTAPRWSQPSPERDWLRQDRVLQRAESDFFKAQHEREAAGASALCDFLVWLRAKP